MAAELVVEGIEKRGAQQATSRTPPKAGLPKQAAPRRWSISELPIVLTLAVAVIAYAWTRRNEGDLTAETGLGYSLGIAGALAMLILLIYPLRKRFVKLRYVGDVRSWFRIHMMLGIIGPVLIILHSNFVLGSLNSRLALFAMLIVAGSGLIGRLFYARIHRGLYGRRATVREYLADMESFKAAFDDDMRDPAWLRAILNSYEKRRPLQSSNFWINLGRTIVGVATRFMLRRQIMRRYIQMQKRKNRLNRDRTRSVRQHLDGYLNAVARAQSFALYERLFSLWHLFHLPLFVILVFATIIHVVGVHLY